MYANLKVTTAKGKTLAAWKVEVVNGKAKVYLDGQDGTGNYAEKAGVLVLSGAFKVEASY
jgi:hypothetical protein